VDFFLYAKYTNFLFLNSIYEARTCKFKDVKNHQPEKQLKIIYSALQRLKKSTLIYRVLHIVSFIIKTIWFTRKEVFFN
jgi:hypothetical protein